MLFSIVIPCYNVEKYISNTIESVLNQTYNDLEIILVNDGSSDNTLNILKQYEKQCANIKVFDKLNGGVSSARNLGIKNSTGDYLHFLDGDDTISNDLFEKMYKFILNNRELDMISFGYTIVKSNTEKEILSFLKYNDKLFDSNSFLSLYLNRRIRQSMCSFVVKKDILIQNKIIFDENTSNGEDQEFQIKTIYHSGKITYISKSFFNYQMRKNSASSSVATEKNLTLINVFERLLSYFDNLKSNKQFINELKIYSLLEYFYVFRLVSKSDNKKLIKQVIEKKLIIRKKINLKFNKISIALSILKVLYKISPSFLSWILKKV